MACGDEWERRGGRSGQGGEGGPNIIARRRHTTHHDHTRVDERSTLEGKKKVKNGSSGVESRERGGSEAGRAGGQGQAMTRDERSSSSNSSGEQSCQCAVTVSCRSRGRIAHGCRARESGGVQTERAPGSTRSSTTFPARSVVTRDDTATRVCSLRWCRREESCHVVFVAR